MSEDCDPVIYEFGTPVAVIADRNGAEIEELVLLVSKRTNTLIDWYWMAGRAVVKAINNLELVRNAFRPYTNGYFVVVEEDGTWTR